MTKTTALILALNTAVADPPKKERAKESFRRVTWNLSPKVRHDKMAGKDYLVVPMVMLTEGVHNGSLGPLLYKASEISKLPQAWNMKPVIVYHPVGNAETACEPSVIDSQGVGVIMNTKVVEEEVPAKAAAENSSAKVKVVKLTAEAWLEESRLKQVDERVYDAVMAGTVTEVSTGLYTENEESEGEWRGESYKAIATNFRPDHLAILPDVKGACSVKDGAGLNRNQEGSPTLNEASFDALRGLVSTALSAEHGEYTCYVVDLFTKFAIYSKGSKLYKQNYSASDTAATLEGDPVVVVRVIQYRSPDGSVVNSERDFNMDKAKLITALILACNGAFTEADKPYLMGKNEDQLIKLASTFGLNKDGAKETPKPAENKETPAPVPAMAQNSTGPVPAPVKKPTLNEYIASAPPEIANLLGSALRQADAVKNSLVENIVACPRNGYTKEQLGAKDIDELKIIAKGFGVDGGSSSGAPTYAGLADAFGAPSRGAQGSTHNEEPLALPAWNMLEETPAKA